MRSAHASPKGNSRPVSGRQWFANTNWEKIEAELVGRLQSSDRDVVRRAAVALGHTGGEAAGDALRQYVLAHRDDNPFPAWRERRLIEATPLSSTRSHQSIRARLQAATRSLGYLRRRRVDSSCWQKRLLSTAIPKPAICFWPKRPPKHWGAWESRRPMRLWSGPLPHSDRILTTRAGMAITMH